MYDYSNFKSRDQKIPNLYIGLNCTSNVFFFDRATSSILYCSMILDTEQTNFMCHYIIGLAENGTEPSKTTKIFQDRCIPTAKMIFSLTGQL